jgi:DNA-binding SARP family transcriptional activator
MFGLNGPGVPGCANDDRDTGWEVEPRAGWPAGWIVQCMEFRVLGPLEVWCDGRRVPVSAAKQRTLLAILLLRAGRVVAAEELIDRLWGERPPATARKTLHNYVRRLRMALAAGADASAVPPMLLTEPTGYLLRLGDAVLDLHRFEQLREQAQQAASAGNLDRAAGILRQALGLWRGPALADVVAETLLRTEAVRLEERRLAALEARIQAELDLGRHAELVGELEALAAQHPLRESFCGQLMLALYRCGRQVDALGAYRAARRLLTEEFGVEPGSELQRLERAILVADPSLAAPARSAPSAPMAQTPDWAIPAQLPADVADFTGRGQHLEQLDRLLTGDWYATAVVISAIAGTAGVGKTALAVHWAHRARDRFPDGQLYVRLQGSQPNLLDPAEVLAGLLRDLGVQGAAIPAALEERSRLYRALLADRRVLVVLDDAAGEAQVRPLLPGSSGCGVLVTSRRALAGLEGVHLLALDVLPRMEAMELLGKLAGPERVEAEAQAAEVIAERCGLLPLALRIAGAKLAANPRWRLEELAGRLADEHHRLGELHIGDLDVRASFALSYLGLDPAARRLFRLLGVLELPDLPGWVAAALLDTGPAEAAAVLDRLVEAQLVENAGYDPAGQLRYRLHDLLRAYARERLLAEEPAPQRESALGRVLGAYLDLAEEADAHFRPGGQRYFRLPGVARWPVADLPAQEVAEQDPLTWYRAEHANLIAAVEQAHATGYWGHTWALAYCLAVYLDTDARWSDFQHTHELGLEAAQRGVDPEAEAWLLQHLGQLHSRRGELAEAISHYERARERFCHQGNRWGELESLIGLFVQQIQAGRLKVAHKLGMECLTSSQALADRFPQGIVLRWMGTVHLQQGQLHKAAACFEQSAAMFRELGGDPGWEAVNLVGLGDTCAMQGRFNDALAYLHRSLALLRDMGWAAGEARALRALGDVLRRQGRAEEAIGHLEQGLELIGNLADPAARAALDRSLGETLHALGRLDEAAIHLTRAQSMYRRTGYRLEEASVLHSLCRVRAASGNLIAASLLGHRANRILQELDAAG